MKKWLPTTKTPLARSAYNETSRCKIGTSVHSGQSEPMGRDSKIRKNEMAIRKNPSFEYYCRVLAILRSRSLSRVSRKALAWFLGDEGGVTGLS
jgi:hypothetical protein